MADVAKDEVLVTVYCVTLGVTDNVTTGDTGYLLPYVGFYSRQFIFTNFAKTA